MESCADLLASETGLSKQAIKQAMNKGAVWLTRNNKTDRLRRVNKTLRPGDRIHIYYDEAVLKREPDTPILIDDKGSYSVWNKPCGMLSQGTHWGDHCSLARWAEKNLQPTRNVFIVHRLDREATGLILLAHNKSTAAYFSALFQDRNIEKHYSVVVHGHLKQTINLNNPIEGKPASSLVNPLQYDPGKDMTLLNVIIDTGRKHQIRRHLSAAGFPIVGDRLYGSSSEQTNTALHLTSCYLAFICPDTKQKVSYSLPQPHHL